MHSSCPKYLILAAAILASPSAHAQFEGVIVGIGDLATNVSPANTRAEDVSYDGSIVVGSSLYGGPIRWTFTGGISALPNPIGGGSAEAISRDGSTVVGFTQGLKNASTMFRYRNGMFENLGDLKGGIEQSFARGVSNSGAVVVGVANGDEGSTAVRWDGQFNILGWLSGQVDSDAAAVSADGSIIVGGASYSNGTQAFRWTADTGMTILSDLPGGINGGWARDITGDGSLVVGSGWGTTGNQACYWTTGDPVPLGVPSGARNSFAKSVSDDGKVIIGYANATTGSTVHQWIWTPTSGILKLSDYLLANGSTGLGTWVLDSVGAVSGDGTTIVGSAHHQGETNSREGFVLRIPPPGSVYATQMSLDGGFVSGGTLSLCRLLDDRSWRVQKSDDSDHVQVTFKGTSPIASPTTIAITYSGSPARQKLIQSVSLWNFVRNEATILDSSMAPVEETTQTFAVTNGAEYIGPNGEVRATMAWVPINDEHPLLNPWTSSINTFRWQIR